MFYVPLKKPANLTVNLMGYLVYKLIRLTTNLRYLRIAHKLVGGWLLLEINCTFSFIKQTSRKFLTKCLPSGEISQSNIQELITKSV